MSAAVAAVRARAVAVPIWFWLAGIVVFSVAFRIELGRQIVAPWIMVDELIYSELAKSFAASGHFELRGVPQNGYGFVYPMLIAPAWRLFASVPSAFSVAKGINAVLMSLTAVPVYFLARRVVAPALALVAAALAVLVPSMLYSGMLMTENAFYPLFAVTCLALVLALERPAASRQVLVLVLCAVAYATRAQAVALVPAVAVAPLLLGAFDRDVRGRLRAFAPLYGILGGCAVLAVVATVARGRSPLTLLGAYRSATNVHYSPWTIARYLLWHVSELDLYLGVVPFAALLVLWLSGRSLPPPARALAAASLPVTAFLLVEVAAFATQPSVLRIEERNMFYVAPFAFVALVAVGGGAIPRRRVPYAIAALVAGSLPATIPFDRFITTSAVSDTFGLLPWWWVQDHFLPLDDIRWAALMAALAAAALFFVLPRRYVQVLPAIVAAYFLLTTTVVQNGRHGLRIASTGTLWAGIKVQHPDWVDRAVGHHADVAFLWDGRLGAQSVWETEFFNRSIRTVYDLGGASPGGLPETSLRASRSGKLATTSGRIVRVRYILSSAISEIDGKIVARDPRVGLNLLRVDGPLVGHATKVTGLYPGDTWSGAWATYSRTACSGGRALALLQSDPALYDVDQVVTARVGGRVAGVARVHPRGVRWLSVTLQPDAHRICRVSYTMAVTRVPAEWQPGVDDPRALGVHFVRFAYLP